MSREIKRRYLAWTLITCMIVTMFSTVMSYDVSAFTVISSISAERSITEKELFLDNDNPENNVIVLDYEIKIEPILIENQYVESVPDSNVAGQEIVLIIDSSESMELDIAGGTVGKKRMDMVKEAAISYLDELRYDPLVKVSIVDFNEKAYIYNGNSPLVNLKTSYDDLVEYINGIETSFGTNYGDGLRRGYHILNNGNSDADQHLIMLTDGQANALSLESVRLVTNKNNKTSAGIIYENYGQKQTEVVDIKNVKYLSTDGDPETYFVNIFGNGYFQHEARKSAFNIADMLKKTDVTSHIIGFTTDIHHNTLTTVANKASAGYHEAATEEELDEIYLELVSEVESEVIIESVKFEEKYPDKVEIINYTDGMNPSGQTLTKTFNIPLKVNEAGTHYIADSIKFSVDVRPSEEGVYVFGENYSSGIHFVDLDNKDKDIYFKETTLFVYETDENLMPNTVLEVLEVQPGRVFELNENELNNVLDGLTVDIDQISMTEFVGNIEKVNGHYDVVYIGAIEGYSDYTLTGTDNETVTIDIDITDRKAADIIEYANTGQLLIIDDELLLMDDTKIQSNILTVMDIEDSNVYEVSNFSSTLNDLNEWYGMATHRPRLTVLSQPEAYDGKTSSYEQDHFMSFLYSGYNEYSNLMDTYLSIDLDGDGIYESNEQVLKEQVNISASGLTLNYALEDDFNGLMPWKLELVDKETNAKDYLTGYTAYKGEKTVVNVLQLSPGTDRMNIDGKDFKKALDTDEYEINITYMQVSDFDAAYAEWEVSENQYPASVDNSPTVLNGNYDMIIFGFGDSYSGEGGIEVNKDLTSQSAVDAINEFISTGQSILFTHDTAGPQDVNNEETRPSDDKSYNDIVTYNDALNITSNFKDDMGFANIRTSAGKGIWKAWGSDEAFKLNEGLITMYPYILADNVSNTLDIAETHDQYWNINLEDENVVPWFTLEAGDLKYYPEAYYYTFSNGNITYSGTGHSTPKNAEEQEFFVNTMLKASTGANHKPYMDVENIYDGMNIVPSVREIGFDLTIHDVDFQDQYFTTEVYTVFDGHEIRGKLLTNVSKDVPVSIEFDKPPILDESVEEFVLKIVVTDEHGAQGVEEYNVTHKEIPTLTINDNVADGYLKGDVINLTYEVGTVKESDKDLISNIQIESTIDKSKTDVVNADSWNKTGFTYSATPSFDGNTSYSMILTAGSSDALPLVGTYDVVFSEGGDTLEDQVITKETAINVKTGSINVEVSDNLGRAIENATVEITNDSGVLVATGDTDMTGLYKASNLTSDKYTVVITTLPTGYETLDINSADVSLSYNNAMEIVEFSAKDNNKPIIDTQYDIDIILTGGAVYERPVHVKVDGNTSKVVAVYTKKLEGDERSAEANDFVGANAGDNELLSDYNSSNVKDELKVTPFTLDETKEEGFEKAAYFTVTENGYYAIYAINEAGNESVEVIHINSLIIEFPDNL